MKYLSKILLIGILLTAVIAGCEEIKSYPEIPEIKYTPPFQIFITEDALGNEIYLGKIKFEFTDGDGNLGLRQPADTFTRPDSAIYNIYMELFEKNDTGFAKSDTEELKYRIPYIEREGQNKTLTGTITIDLEYRTLEYDTIFYTFYIVDRDYNKSNVDSTEVLIFTGLRDSMELR
jgi:hypothetical protein